MTGERKELNVRFAYLSRMYGPLLVARLGILTLLLFQREYPSHHNNNTIHIYARVWYYQAPIWPRLWLEDHRAHHFAPHRGHFQDHILAIDTLSPTAKSIDLSEHSLADSFESNACTCSKTRYQVYLEIMSHFAPKLTGDEWSSLPCPR